MNHWLLKSEPESYSISDLEKAPLKTTAWEGVRNYQARNFMRDQMKKGDLCFFYHSSCKQPGIAGIVEVVREAYPDETAHNPESHYYDPKSSSLNPRWFHVDVRLIEKFVDIIPLSLLKQDPLLTDMVILRKGNRLSITPVTLKEWTEVLKYTAQVSYWLNL